jgi:hypothetical protein
MRLLFLRQTLAFEEFASGTYDTGIIERYTKSPPEWTTEGCGSHADHAATRRT